jgi:hypothetical protein
MSGTRGLITLILEDGLPEIKTIFSNFVIVQNILSGEMRSTHMIFN